MKSRYPLKSLYSKGNREAYFTEFFKRTLLIQDVSTENFLEELNYLRSIGCTAFVHINGIYESMNRMRPTITTAVEKKFK